MTSAQKRLFVKAGFLSLLTIFSLQLVQLRLVPGSSATRPLTPFFLLIFLNWLLYAKSVNASYRTYIDRSIVARWSGFLLVTVLYAGVSLALLNTSSEVARFSVSIISVLLFYWMGYSGLGIRREIFLRFLLLSYYPLLLLGIVEIAGVLFFRPILEIVSTFRDIVLTYQIDRERLHLAFSEPSFLSTYLLLLLFIIERNEMPRMWRRGLYVMVALIGVFTQSMTVLAVLVAFCLAYAYEVGKLRLSFLSFIVGIAAIAAILLAVGARLLTIQSDLSSYIRLMNVLGLLDMGIQNYGFGSGIGGFSNYFVSFLGGQELRGSEELANIVGGESEAAAYSMVGVVFAYMGLPGALTFIYLILSGIRKANCKYKLAAFVAMLSALPWGLPYCWVLLGLVDRETQSKQQGESVT